MNKSILARNILILEQLGELTNELSKNNIPTILLKGVSLIETIDDYIGERQMEDIDLLFRPCDIAKVRDILLSLGYTCASEDPWAFNHKQKIVYVDIIDNIWYLNKRENEELFKKSRGFATSQPLTFHLPPCDLLIHVLAHCSIHHAKKEQAWINDIKVIKEKWGKQIDWREFNNKIKKYNLKQAFETYFAEEGFLPNNKKSKLYSWLLYKEIPQKGHILRFLCLPFIKKLPYLLKSVYPCKNFIKHRYNLKNNFQIFFYRLLRPLLLFFSFIRFVSRLIRS